MMRQEMRLAGSSKYYTAQNIRRRRKSFGINFATDKFNGFWRICNWTEQNNVYAKGKRRDRKVAPSSRWRSEHIGTSVIRPVFLLHSNAADCYFFRLTGLTDSKIFRIQKRRWGATPEAGTLFVALLESVEDSNNEPLRKTTHDIAST
jgi:hypothetical protein